MKENYNMGKNSILADEMGLGKTLTAISLIYTCLTQSPYGNPAISSAVVTCPSSLVENWSSEFMSEQPVEITHRKWLGRDKLRCIVINEKGSKAEEKVKTFVLQSEMKRTVLIISYEVCLFTGVERRCSGNTPVILTRARRDCSSVTKAID